MLSGWTKEKRVSFPKMCPEDTFYFMKFYISSFRKVYMYHPLKFKCSVFLKNKDQISILKKFRAQKSEAVFYVICSAVPQKAGCVGM